MRQSIINLFKTGKDYRIFILTGNNMQRVVAYMEALQASLQALHSLDLVKVMTTGGTPQNEFFQKNVTEDDFFLHQEEHHFTYQWETDGVLSGILTQDLLNSFTKCNHVFLCMPPKQAREFMEFCSARMYGIFLDSLKTSSSRPTGYNTIITDVIDEEANPLQYILRHLQEQMSKNYVVLPALNIALEKGVMIETG